MFFARFISLLRVTAAWIAGMSHMNWWRFLFWNALGGIVWAIGFGLLAYYTGHVIADAIGKYGLYAVIGIVALGAIAFFGMRFRKRRSRSSG